MTNKKEIKWDIVLTRIATMMTISVPIFYLIGYFYYRGYLDAFGIDAELFPKSIQDYLVSSFFAIFHVIMKILTLTHKKYLFVVLFAIGIFFMTLFMIWLGKKRFFDNVIIMIKRWKYYEYVAIPFLASCITLITPYFAVLILASLIAFPSLGYLQGQENAKKDITKFKEWKLGDETKEQYCIFISKKDVEVLKGLFIAKSNTHIAIWTGESIEIYPYDKERFEIKKNTQNAEPDRED